MADVESVGRIDAVCQHCSRTMDWRQAQTHLCKWVRIEVTGLLPRNDIDISDPELVRDIGTTIKDALGLQEIDKTVVQLVEET